ncbi:hypothetical protein MP228_011178 [Amoeboaphelidium protococcarum]|nr:hypothetical protein MP228_011178 [Amoeboaphelidium protococcarum]
MNFSQVVILWVVSVVFIYYFQKGFLLARLALPDVSQEDESNTVAGISAKHNKIVIMLIDALRYDFISPDPQLLSYNDGQVNKNFHLNMPAMSDRVKNVPQNARLLHFTADPPTTTLQRLQALLTGSLPTFIDAASNFNSDKLKEDNWVLQAAKKHKILFFGDDTWIQTLGYDHFVNGSEGYESFEVWDLDTVDKSIDRRIWKYIEQENLDKWDVMVTHWLGIDHAGHIYGPDHSEMKRKQVDLNQAVEKVILQIDKLNSRSERDNILLFVFGDHGMNSQGDHGGDSMAEVDAGLFVYSASPVFDQYKVSSTSETSLSYEQMSQIDLVPTLCALLGVTIPFSNLGFLNLDLLKSLMAFKANDEGIQLNSLAKRNYNQIVKYLNAYSAHSRLDFDGQQSGESIKDFAQFQQAGKSILEKLRHIWARFNLDLMILASFGLILTVLVFSFSSKQELLVHFSLSDIVLILSFGTVLGVSLYNLQVLDGSRSDLILITSIVSLLVSILLRQSSSVDIWDISCVYSLSIDTLPVLLALFHCFIYTSNSLVVHEDHVCVYLLQSVLALCLVRGVQPKWKIISAMFITRYLSVLSSCREEKGRQCLNTFKAHPLSLVKDLPLLSPQYLSNYQHAIQLGILILLSSICLYLSRSFGKITFISLCKYAFILTFIAFYWAVDGNTWFMDVRFQGILIHHMLMRICMLLSGAWFLQFIVSQQPESKANVFDLIPIMHCIASCAQSLPGVIVLSLVTIACQLLVSTSNDQESVDAGWQIAVFYLLGNVAFFATGHQAAFSSIQFESGFIGLEAFNFYLSGGLVILNSVGGWLLCTAALALTLCRDQNNNAVQSKWKTFILVILVDITMSCVFTAQFRRHLMVWKVFAPRFMLAAVDFIIRGGVSVFLYLCIKQDGTWYNKDQQ